MDYKKKYEEAMLRMNKWVEGSEIIDPKEVAEYVFPELKESKDERVRKSLIGHLKECRNGTHSEVMIGEYAKWIAWLEKQGEQKSTEIHPIFRVGDYIRNKKTNDKVLIEQLDVKLKTYCYTSYDGAAKIHSDFPFSKQDEWELIGQKIVEQKPTWSEEDEPIFNELVAFLEKGEYKLQHDLTMYAHWLKSLKERYTWKPSDEQIKALNYVVNLMASSESPTENDYYYNVFKDMRTQLKKLKEE